ncbi:MAG: metal-dependent hydrolase [Alicyclobacillaceae bacterium]|nr:metal-dependent hydrolase [Alicyclobacillaceae bacterium]
MVYDTHAAFGAALMETILVAEHASLSWQAGAAVALACACAVLPDIDHPSSWITQRVDPLGLVSKVFRHRTFTHSLILSALLYLVLFVVFPGVPVWLASGVLVGWMSHWLIDLTNPAGVMLFWPFPTRGMQQRIHWNGFVRNPVKWLTIPVESTGEDVAKILLKLYTLFVAVLYLLAHFPLDLGFLSGAYQPVRAFAAHTLSYVEWRFLAHAALALHIGV